MTTIELLQDITARGIRLELEGGEMTVEGNEDVLTDEILTTLEAHKDELVGLLFCRHCASPMEQIEAGYFYCQACHYQTVEPRSGYWSQSENQKEKLS